MLQSKHLYTITYEKPKILNNIESGCKCDELGINGILLLTYYLPL